MFLSDVFLEVVLLGHNPWSHEQKCCEHDCAMGIFKNPPREVVEMVCCTDVGGRRGSGLQGVDFKDYKEINKLGNERVQW